MEVGTSTIPAEENFTATTAVINNGSATNNLNNAVKYIYKTAAKNKNATDKLAMLAFLPFTNRKKLIEEISNRHQPEFVIDNPYIESNRNEKIDINKDERAEEGDKEQVNEEKTSNLTKLLLNASNNQNFLHINNNNNNATLTHTETTTETVTERTTRTTTTCTTINSNVVDGTNSEQALNNHNTSTQNVPSTSTSMSISSATASAASSLSSTYSLSSSETTKSSSSDNLLNVGLDFVDAAASTTTNGKHVKSKNFNNNNDVATLSTLAKNVAVKRNKQEEQAYYGNKQRNNCTPTITTTTATTTPIVTTTNQHSVVSIKHSNRIPSDVLDDLASRFVINVPDIELTNLIRVCFQIELAHWFYLDFFCSTISKHQQNQQNQRERKKQQQQQQQQEEEDKLKISDKPIENSIVEVITTTTPHKNTTSTATILETFNNEDDAQKLQPCGIKYFALQLFEHIPFLRKHSASVEKILDDWKNYKLSVPTFGAILISEDLNYCLLVQSYFAKSSWGFPKGKVNENEDPVHCATREVYEETGYDISNIIDPNDYIESVINYQYTRLYLVHNVSLNTQFAPRTRYEIRCCDWFPIDSLPVNKSDAISKSKLGIKTNSFFMIMPFVKRLKRWVNDKRNLIETGGLVTVEGVEVAKPATSLLDNKIVATTTNLSASTLFSPISDPFAIPSQVVRLTTSSTTTVAAAAATATTTMSILPTPNRKLMNNNMLNNNRRRHYSANGGSKSPINQQQQQQQNAKDNYTPSALLLSSGKLLKINNNMRSDELTFDGTTSTATTTTIATTSSATTTIKKRLKTKEVTKQANEVMRKNSIKHSNSAAKLPQKVEELHRRERHKSMGDLDVLNAATTTTSTTTTTNAACAETTAITATTPLAVKTLTKSKRQLFQSRSVNETIYNGITLTKQQDQILQQTQMLKNGYNFADFATSSMKEFKNKIILDVNTVESQMSPKIEHDLEFRSRNYQQQLHQEQQQKRSLFMSNGVYQAKYMQEDKMQANIELPFKSLSARCTPVGGLNDCLATAANYGQQQIKITSPKCATPPMCGEHLLAVAVAAANHNNNDNDNNNSDDIKSDTFKKLQAQQEKLQKRLKQSKLQLLKDSYKTTTKTIKTTTMHSMSSTSSSSSSSSTISSDASNTPTSYAASPIHMQQKQQQQQQQQQYSYIKHPNSIMPLPTTIRSPITIVSELEAIALERAKTKAFNNRSSTPSAFSKAATQWTNYIVTKNNKKHEFQLQQPQQQQKLQMQAKKQVQANGFGNREGTEKGKGMANGKEILNNIKISAWQDFSFSTNFLQDLFH